MQKHFVFIFHSDSEATKNASIHLPGSFASDSCLPVFWDPKVACRTEEWFLFQKQNKWPSRLRCQVVACRRATIFGGAVQIDGAPRNQRTSGLCVGRGGERS